MSGRYKSLSKAITQSGYLSISPLDIRIVERSDLCGFWKRLKKLGWLPSKMWTTSYRRGNNDYNYLRTCWSFIKDNCLIIFTITPHFYRFMVTQKTKDATKVLFNTGNVVSWSFLEQPFLQYFKETTPLCISRLGRQDGRTRIWLRKKKKEQLLLELQRKRLAKKTVVGTK